MFDVSIQTMRKVIELKRIDKEKPETRILIRIADIMEVSLLYVIVFLETPDREKYRIDFDQQADRIIYNYYQIIKNNK